MARIRTIKPQFFMNEDMAELPPLSRLLFVGLWTLADKEGRLEDRPKRIKAHILPYDDYDIDAALDQLADGLFIMRYSFESHHYIQINNFKKHQRITGTEADAESTIPAPENGLETPGKQSGNAGETPGKQPGNTQDDRNGREGKGKEEREARAEIPESSIPPLADHSFTRFKELMPLRNGKFIGAAECETYWNRHPAMWNQWIRAAPNYRASEEVQAGYACSPMKFLTSKWRDWLTPEEKPTGEKWVPDLSWQKERAEDLRKAQERLARKRGKSLDTETADVTDRGG